MANEFLNHSSHAKPGILPFPDRLFVVTAISNPARYRSRYDLYRAFEKRVEDAGAILHTVELAYGGRPHEITESNHPRHLQVRTNDELWHKENLLNLGINRLPPEARYIAIIDADLLFVRPDWAQETLHQLQHTPVVQMYSEIAQLGPEGNQVSHGLSFVEAWFRGLPLITKHGRISSDLYHHHTRSKKCQDYPGSNSELGSPGGAWAFRREALDGLGGLLDCNIIGSSDYHMAASLFGFAEYVVPREYPEKLREAIFTWQERARLHIRHNVGAVPGLVLHHWHGKISQRGYGERWKILVKHNFNPALDLKRDSQGVYKLHDDGSHRFTKLRDDLRTYFRSRNEDSIDL